MTIRSSSSNASASISIHTSAREVTRLQRLSVLRFKISIHTSAREVTLKCTSRPTLYAISIHTSAREVTVDRMDMPEALGNFNPHFRKGSDHNYTVVYAVFMISIHTSAREVTNPDPKLDPVSYISIHTSAREVTYPVRNIPASPGNFNPHFRKGSDRKLDSNICRSHISIHTSAREVTHRTVKINDIIDIFQSTLPQGK